MVYEVQLTPLQILTFYNAVANNGKMVKPRFVKEIGYHGRVIKIFNTEVLNSSIVSRSTIKKAKIMLEGVVENGTATNLKNSNYKIAGKTGTAQIANSKYGYKQGGAVSYQASFVGYFPADNPLYSCIVVLMPHRMQSITVTWWQVLFLKKFQIKSMQLNFSKISRM